MSFTTSKWIACPKCHGSGMMVRTKPVDFTIMSLEEALAAPIEPAPVEAFRCPECEGRGGKRVLVEVRDSYPAVEPKEIEWGKYK